MTMDLSRDHFLTAGAGIADTGMLLICFKLVCLFSLAIGVSLLFDVLRGASAKGFGQGSS